MVALFFQCLVSILSGVEHAALPSDSCWGAIGPGWDLRVEVSSAQVLSLVEWFRQFDFSIMGRRLLWVLIDWQVPHRVPKNKKKALRCLVRLVRMVATGGLETPIAAVPPSDGIGLSQPTETI